MSATKFSPGTPFRTIAGCLCGTVANVFPSFVANLMIASVARTNAIANGSFDLVLEQPIDTTKHAILVKGSLGGAHNLASDYGFPLNDGQTLRVTFRDDAATLTDPVQFSVDIERIAN